MQCMPLPSAHLASFLAPKSWCLQGAPQTAHQEAGRQALLLPAAPACRGPCRKSGGSPVRTLAACRCHLPLLPLLVAGCPQLPPLPLLLPLSGAARRRLPPPPGRCWQWQPGGWAAQLAAAGLAGCTALCGQRARRRCTHGCRQAPAAAPALYHIHRPPPASTQCWGLPAGSHRQSAAASGRCSRSPGGSSPGWQAPRCRCSR